MPGEPHSPAPREAQKRRRRSQETPWRSDGHGHPSPGSRATALSSDRSGEHVSGPEAVAPGLRRRAQTAPLRAAAAEPARTAGGCSDRPPGTALTACVCRAGRALRSLTARHGSLTPPHGRAERRFRPPGRTPPRPSGDCARCDVRCHTCLPRDGGAASHDRYFSEGEAVTTVLPTARPAQPARRSCGRKGGLWGLGASVSNTAKALGRPDLRAGASSLLTSPHTRSFQCLSAMPADSVQCCSL